MPFFSIIIATRDRTELFAEALASVQGQEFQDIEIIVVNDGSNDKFRSQYDAIVEKTKDELGGRFQFHSLVQRSRGHGQSYSFNFGVDQAKGEYLCFLDDDDTWTDMAHLVRVSETIDEMSKRGKPVDLYMSTQAAFLLGERKTGPIWLDSLEEELQQRRQTPINDTFYEISVADLIQTSGFCHLNNLIIRRPLYHAIGGMDEGVRWECDRDVFLRLIDHAKTICFAPPVISRHNIPDPAKSNNMTTSLSMLEKRLCQVRVLDKSSLFAKHSEIRRQAHLHKAFALKKISEELFENGNFVEAARYAREALGAGPTFKWLLFAIWLTFRGCLARWSSPHFERTR